MLIAAIVDLTTLGSIAALLVGAIAVWNWKSDRKLAKASTIGEEVQTLTTLLTSQRDRLHGNDERIASLEREIRRLTAKQSEAKTERVALRKDLENKE